MPAQKIDLNELVRQIREQEQQFEREDSTQSSSPSAKPGKIGKPPRINFERTPRPEPAQFWTRGRIGVAVWVVLVLILGGVLWPRLRNSREILLPASSDSTRVNLDLPMMQILGSPKGPYLVSEVLGPNRFHLSGSAGDIECILLGLSSAMYPLLPPEEPGEPQTPAADAQEIKDYLAGRLRDYCANQKFWIIQMGGKPPVPVYLLHPLNANTPRGEAELVNAILLRKGYAVLDFSDPNQPLFSALADCQRDALREFDQRSAPGDSVWYHYRMAFPRDQLPQAAPAPKP